MSFVQTESDALKWHKGEVKMHTLLRVPYQENPTSPFLTPGAAFLAQTAPILAIGTLDALQRPWTSIWGGEPGFARSLGSSVLGVKTLVDMKHDPVIEALLGGSEDGEVVKEDERVGRPVSGLFIDLMKRKRVKLFGRMIAGALSQVGSGLQEGKAAVGEVQLVVKVEQSLGNCPKYLNKKEITASLPDPKRLSDSLPLRDEAIKLLAKADLFFISSSNQGCFMGTNYRGGPSGFVRLVSNDAAGVTLAYPEYSGNRLYQTLGNLQTTPKAGFVFPDFGSGDVLYITASTEVLVGEEAAATLPRSNLVVRVNVTAALFIQHGLPFRGRLSEASPYNPPIRYLPSERIDLGLQATHKGNTVSARLIRKDLLTPTIARFRLRISNSAAIGRPTPGQYVALSFEDELSIGYSHMRDDDPKSLNDDYVRTFTVSSMPEQLPEDEFEITIRKVGDATRFMFRQSERNGLEIPLRGFGGEFVIKPDVRGFISFVAGGIGITPLLGQLSGLDMRKVRLFWTINIRDIGLAMDTFDRNPRLATSTTLFVSGEVHALPEIDEDVLVKLDALGARIIKRRLLATDLQDEENHSSKWYICAGTALRKSLMEWLGGKEVVYEDFDY